MKVRVSEASGFVLDWMVAKVEGALHPLGNVVIEGASLWVAIDGNAHHYMEEDVRYEPSFDWAQGGPIISRERISIRHWTNVPIVHAYMPDSDWSSDGESALVAAMRAYAASKLGEEVEVPDGLA